MQLRARCEELLRRMNVRYLVHQSPPPDVTVYYKSSYIYISSLAGIVTITIASVHFSQSRGDEEHSNQFPFLYLDVVLIALGLSDSNHFHEGWLD
jgi:hypothetical protein